MKKEIQSREIRMGNMARNWLYNRSGVDERPIDSKPSKPVVLFDEGSIQRGWNRERFSGVIEE